MDRITISNKIPPPSGPLVEEAVRAAIGDLPGEWSGSLVVDDGVGEYQIRLRNNGGPTWRWFFVDAEEQRPTVIRDRIATGLRGQISKAVRQRRQEVLEAACRHGGSNLRIFGSQARGDSRPDSDLDVLLSLEPGRSLFDLIAIKLDLQQLLSCKVDVVTEEGLRPEAKGRILQEAAPL